MKITGRLKRISRQPYGYSILASGTAVSFLGKSVGRGLNMALQVILARWLGPELFGVYVIAWTFLRMLGLITPLGLDLAIIRFGTAFIDDEPERFKGIVKQSWSLALIAGAVCSILLFWFAPLIARFYGQPELSVMLRWFAPAFFFLAGMRIVVSTTKVTQRMTYAIIIEELLWPGLNLLLVVGLVWLGFGFTGSAVAVVVSLAVAFILGTIWLLYLFPVLRAREVTAVSDVRSLISFSIPAIFAFATGVYLYWVDRLMMGVWLPSSDVGIYQAVGQFSFVFATILASLNAVMMPIIAKHLHNKQMDELGQIFRVATKWGIYLSVPIFLGIWIEPVLLIEVVFGIDYVAGTAVLLILITTQIFNVSTGAVNHLLILSGNQQVWLRLSILTLILNVTLNFLLLPTLGMEGAAIATAVSITGLFMAGLWQTKKRLGLWPYDKRYLKGFLATIITYVGLLIWQQLIYLPNIPYLILTFVISGCLFIGTLLLLGLDEEDKALVSLLPFSI